MKRLLAIGVLVLALTVLAGSARAAVDEYDDMQSYPLRVVAYLIYPVGYTAEWLIFRPFHYLVSRPQLEPVFGHRPHQEVGWYN